MAVYRDELGHIDRQDFENHLKAQVRNESYMQIVMYTPNSSVQVAEVYSNDKSDICNINTITDITKFTSTTVASLEENLWLLNGRFINYQGGLVDGYISNSISDDNGDFNVTPEITVRLSHTIDIENFAVVLNSAVPSGYPKDITVKCYDENANLLGLVKEYIEKQELTGEVDDEDNPIYKTVLLDSLPSVNFNLNKENVAYLVIEFGSTRFRHRRIRVSSITFGKTVILNEEQIMNADYSDKTSYVCDTLPSRTFSFDVNNYDSIYNVDNPDNGYVSLNRQTIVRFRNGYNVAGYEYENDGHVKMQGERPVMNPAEYGLVEIEWDNWKELRLMDISANADESVTFTAGSLLDVMEDTYTTEYYSGSPRTVQEIAEDVLKFEGLDLNSIEWSSDGILVPAYNSQTSALLPYEQWEDTPYGAYTINTPIPEVQCKQVLQLLAFSIGATILIKDNGHIKFANLNIEKPTSFANNYSWTYHDFEDIPAAEQLETIPGLTDLSDISLPKYYSELDYSGEETYTDTGGHTYANCKVITTITCTNMNTEATYSDCMPVGARIKNGETFEGSISYTELYNKRGIIQLGGFSSGDEVQIEILGYPINTKQLQERSVTSNSLVLDTQIMNYDVNTYTDMAQINEREQIKRKYQKWYTKKFKYAITTRGEPLVNAGDYGIIQTQFTGEMPVYILQNHWTFDGTWSGDMEVIALG